jgi:hypothetical protein
MILPAVIALLILALVPPPARADGDPASDVLLLQDVFVSYESVSAKPLSQLRHVVAESKKAGFPVRVALIASSDDLGSEFGMWNSPQPYARFLNEEISFNSVRPLLVVMPAGFGIDHIAARVGNAIDQVPIAGGTQDGLAISATVAVARMSAALGHPIPGAPLRVPAGAPAPKRHKGKTGWATLAIPGVIVILALAGLAMRFQHRHRDEPA